jgi:hypothetical protein
VTIADYAAARARHDQPLPCVSVIYREHHSFSSVLEQAGIASNARQGEPFGERRLLDSLRRASELAGGQRLTGPRYDRLRGEHPDAELVSSAVIRKRMGGWSDAVTAAGCAT